ncbi:MAG: dihydroorotate dehydrogenase electron transfer subunit, partial [Thermoplasmata archaeon]
MRSVVAVTERVVETPSTVTLRFPYPTAADPGQFVMLWLPGDDELPMSLSYTDGPSKGVTIKAMGATTRRAQSIVPGDRLGVRGPYGNHFDLSPKRVLIVSGGSGAAALAPAAGGA